VLCVVRARGLEHVEDEVLVVSLDRLAAALRAGAGSSPRPPFLARQTSPGRDIQLSPPPRVYPTTPTSGDERASNARP
jgi:hypothetical protein